MSELVLRQLEMLKLIPRSSTGGISTKAIETALNDQGFKISLRSVQRDLEKLSATFPLSSYTDGGANFWFYTLKEGQHVFIPTMDHQAALTFKLAERHLKALIPQQLKFFLEPYFTEADKILKKHPARLKRWLDTTRAISLGVQQQAPEMCEGVWSAISQAIIDRQQCDVVYHSRRFEAPRNYKISPLGIVIRGPVTYLLAVYEGYSDIRQMAMHRFLSASPVVDDAFVPDGFDLDKYIREGQFGILYEESPVRLRMTVAYDIARSLDEVPLGDDQVLEAIDPSDFRSDYRVSCILPESWDLYRWLLSHGMSVRVESPEHIRQTFIGHLQTALDRNASPVSNTTGNSSGENRPYHRKPENA